MPKTGLSADVARPHGRSLDDFRDQPTASRLLPAEDRLLVAVLAGKKCDLSRADATEKIRAALDGWLSGPDAERLAAEVCASPGRLFQSGSQPDDKNEDSKNARLALERRVEALPPIVQEFLKEL